MQHLLPQSLKGFTDPTSEAQLRRLEELPNPSVKRTPNSGPHSAVSVSAVPLLVAPYLKR